MSDSNYAQPESRPLSQVVPGFLEHANVELGFSGQTIIKYHDCLRQVARLIGDLSVTEYGKDHIFALKSAMLARNHSVGRQVTILAALKRILLFCQGELGLPVMDPELIAMPKRPRREVVYLTKAEVESFVSAVRIRNEDGKPCESGIRFRALVEVLLGSAMRISEVLSLNRHDIDFAVREARVIGKGNKPRGTPKTGHIWTPENRPTR